jgi:hypothetical protein
MIKIINDGRAFPYIRANGNNMVLENTSLFFELDRAIPQLEEMIFHYKHSDLLMVVLCQEAMPVASQIARRFGLNLIFSPVDINTELRGSLRRGVPVDFDYTLVKESGRDIPQNFIVHQEQNLRTNLLSVYTEAYKSISNIYPGKLIILVDQLTNIDSEFLLCPTQRYSHQSGGNNFSIPAIRKFVFLHVSERETGSAIPQDLDMIIEPR